MSVHNPHRRRVYFDGSCIRSSADVRGPCVDEIRDCNVEWMLCRIDRIWKDEHPYACVCVVSDRMCRWILCHRTCRDTVWIDYDSSDVDWEDVAIWTSSNRDHTLTRFHAYRIELAMLLLHTRREDSWSRVHHWLIPRQSSASSHEEKPTQSMNIFPENSFTYRWTRDMFPWIDSGSEMILDGMQWQWVVGDRFCSSMRKIRSEIFDGERNLRVGQT